MVSWNANYRYLPLMDNEEVEMSFGDRHGLDAGAMTDGSSIVLTNHRLLSISRIGSSWDMAFMSLGDIQLVEVKRTSRSKGPIFRVAMLIGGAYAAMSTINLIGLALPLATLLGLAAGYHLFKFLSVSKLADILFYTGQKEARMSFRSDMLSQAYDFINCLFRIKEISENSYQVLEKESDVSLL